MSASEAPSANVVLQLAADVRIEPGTAFPADILDRLGGDPGDVVLWQERSRHAAQRLTADAGALIKRFATPTFVLDAIVGHAIDMADDAAAILPDAFALITHLRAQRLLLPPEEVTPASVEPRFAIGARIDSGVAGVAKVCAVVSADTETEIYRCLMADCREVALKWVPTDAPAFVQEASAREASTLAELALVGFRNAPKLIANFMSECRNGESARAMLIDWIDGETGYDVGRNRNRSMVERANLAGRLVAAYADLHARGWLHGDVHPGNVIATATDVFLIDFGGAVRICDRSPPERAGLLTDYEPEAARALRACGALPPSTPMGEQYAVAAIALRLVTGAPTHRLPLDAQAALAIIAEEPARRLRDAGVDWPELDGVLARALALDPNQRFADLAALSRALQLALASPPTISPPAHLPAAVSDPLEAILRFAGSHSVLSVQGIRLGPRASIYHGAAGLALACLTAAEAHDSPAALNAADDWIERAVVAIGDPEAGLAADPLAFDARDLGMAAGELDPHSFFHGAAGVHAVHARVRIAFSDSTGAEAATIRAIAAFGPPCPMPDDPRRSLDLLNGVSGQLLGLAFLADGLARVGALQAGLGVQLAAVAKKRATALAAELGRWFDCPLDQLAANGRYLGIAHGSGGALLALLRAESALPGTLAGIDLLALLERQARLAVGSTFPIERGGSRNWVGWCHGAAGHLSLWVAAAAFSRRDTDHARARKLADVIEARANEGGPTLCCGAAGMAFALAALSALDGVPQFRGDQLRAALAQSPDLLLPHSLWRGHIGARLAELVIEQPRRMVMPLIF